MNETDYTTYCHLSQHLWSAYSGQNTAVCIPCDTKMNLPRFLSPRGSPSILNQLQEFQSPEMLQRLFGPPVEAIFTSAVTPQAGKKDWPFKIPWLNYHQRVTIYCASGYREAPLSTAKWRRVAEHRRGEHTETFHGFQVKGAERDGGNFGRWYTSNSGKQNTVYCWALVVGGLLF